MFQAEKAANTKALSIESIGWSQLGFPSPCPFTVSLEILYLPHHACSSLEQVGCFFSVTFVCSYGYYVKFTVILGRLIWYFPTYLVPILPHSPAVLPHFNCFLVSISGQGTDPSISYMDMRDTLVASVLLLLNTIAKAVYRGESLLGFTLQEG